jgi:hypothetical protein
MYAVVPFIIFVIKSYCCLIRYYALVVRENVLSTKTVEALTRKHVLLRCIEVNVYSSP